MEATMKCPNCRQRAISFFRWGRSLNAFRYACPHCGMLLRASFGTWFWAALLLTTIVVAILFIDRLGLQWNLDEPSRGVLFACIVVPWTIEMSLVAWSVGTYARRKRS